MEEKKERRSFSMKLYRDDNALDWLQWYTDDYQGEIPLGNVVKRDYGNGMKYYYTLSGDVFYPNKSEMPEENFNRIDFKLDILLTKDEERRFKNVVKNNVKGLKFNSYHSSDGKTFYFGSRSRIFLRVYEKGKQMQLLGSHRRWVRFEFEVHGKPLKRLMKTYDDWEGIRRHLFTKFTNLNYNKLVSQEGEIKKLEQVQSFESKDRLEVIMQELRNSGRQAEMLEKLALELGFDLIANAGDGKSRVIY